MVDDLLDDVNTERTGKKKKEKEVNTLAQNFGVRLTRKLSLISTFAAVAGAGAVTMAAISRAHTLVPLTGAFAAAASIMMGVTGIVWGISQLENFDKLDSDEKRKWKNYYKNGKLTKSLGKTSLKTVIVGAAFAAAAAATGALAIPVAPLVCVGGITASAIVAAGTAAVYGMRKSY